MSSISGSIIASSTSGATSRSPTSIQLPEESTTETAETYPTTDSSITVQGAGTVVGRDRTYAEDNINITRMHNIQANQQAIAQTKLNNAITTPATTISVSSKNATTTASITTNTSYSVNAETTKLTSIKPKDEADLTRAIQKLQRRCNHSYSKITSQCVFCNKHRNSHVYD